MSTSCSSATRIHATSPLAADKVEEWERTVAVNVMGVLYGISAVLPRFQAQNRGHLINVSSVAGHVVFPGARSTAGPSSPSGPIAEGFLPGEAGPTIRSTIISPGGVATELANHITDPQAIEQMKAFTEIAIPAEAIAQSHPLCHSAAGERRRQRDPREANGPTL